MARRSRPGRPWSNSPWICFASDSPVIPGWSEGPDRRCAIAHRGISRFRVRCCASPRNDNNNNNNTGGSMATEITIDTGTNELLCVIRDRVAIITLNRPEVRNAMSDALTPALRNMIKACGENPDVGALLLTGAGTAFCAGGNVKGMGAHREPKRLAMSYDEKVADLQERQRLLTG